MSRIKSTVSLVGIQPQMVLADTEVNRVFGVFGYDAMITSGNDGKHRKGSRHYEGLALDYRTFHVARETLPTITRILKWNLSPEFHVQFEDDLWVDGVQKRAQHLHISWIGDGGDP